LWIRATRLARGPFVDEVELLKIIRHEPLGVHACVSQK
jgi:hypothetical protein